MEKSKFITRLRGEISNYFSVKVEVSDGVFFSQCQTIKRIMKFKNRDLTGTKLKEDMSYLYYYDIISPRADSEVKNLSFDSENILVFSNNPLGDFAPVFISNAKLFDWMRDNGEDSKLKDAVEEYVYNGNVGFKRTPEGYDFIDPLNTYITNQLAESIDDTDVIERHELTASQLLEKKVWDKDAVQKTIEECGNKFFNATEFSTKVSTGMNRYELFEYTGEISEEEFNELKGEKDGDSNKYFLAKVVISGLQKGEKGEKNVLFAEKLTKKLSDYYTYAHRGKYTGRFWRVGMCETLFDHQIRANEIGNDIADGLSWASKTLFRSKDTQVMQNIRADLENGEVIITDDLQQVPVEMRGLTELLADWNRLMQDADTISNSNVGTRGAPPPAGQAFSTTKFVSDMNLKMFAFLRSNLTLPYRKVFEEWILPLLVKHLKGQDIFRLVGDEKILDKFREVYVNSWYMEHLVEIGPHTLDIAEAIKAQKLEEVKNIDPVITNASEIWEGVLPRLHVTIAGENYKLEQMANDMVQFLSFEQDPNRLTFLLDSIYAIKGIPIPPKTPQPAPELAQQGGDQGTQSDQVQPRQSVQPQQNKQQPRQAVSR